MANRISGPGLGLPPPANLYPANLKNAASFGENTNLVSLAAGQALPIPSGEWLIGLGPASVLQIFDQLTTAWRTITGGPLTPEGLQYVRSDGFNVRVANMTGCVIGGLVTGSVGSWAQATTTIVPSAGNSTWQPIVGGALSTAPAIVAAGSGYGIAPIVIAPSPPSPGVPASFVATISGGSVNGVTTVNQGAGYAAGTYTLTVIPNPADPNLLAGSAITAATITAAAVGGTSAAGSLTAAILTNAGAPLTAPPTLTVAGSGTSATVVPLWLVVASSISISAGGGGYSSTALLTTIGGNPGATELFTNPAFELTGFVPRPVQAFVTSTAGAIALGAPARTIDKGLFLVTAASDNPILSLISNAAPTTVAAGAITLGSMSDTVIMQQI